MCSALNRRAARLVASTDRLAAAVSSSPTSLASSRKGSMPSRTSSAGARRVARRQLLTELGRRGGHHTQGGRGPGHEDAGVPDAIEVEVSHAAREALRHRPPDLERQAGLADTARAHERDQPDAGALQQLAYLGSLAPTANRLVGGGGQGCGEGTAGTIGQELGIVGEDHALQPAQLRSRLDAQLLHQQRAAGAHRLECLRLPAGAIQRDHQLRPQPLAQRMLRDQRLQLTDEVGIGPAGQLRRQPLLERLQPTLLEARDLDLGELIEAMIRQRVPTPQGERRPQVGSSPLRIIATACQARALQEGLEPVGIDGLWVDDQRVAGGLVAHGGPVTQPLAEARDLLLERRHCARRELVAPEGVEQLVDRNRCGRPQGQHHEQPPLLDAVEADELARNLDLERTQQPDVDL